MPAHDLPLPTFEEVLFCDSMTTSEEVGYYEGIFVFMHGMCMYMKESFMDVVQDTSLATQDTFSLVYVSCIVIMHMP